MANHIVIVRTGSSVLDLKTYNCQELGLAKSLVDQGIKTSLIMAGNEEKIESFPSKKGRVEVYYLKVKALDMRLAIFVGLFDLLNRLAPSLVQIHDMGIYLSYKVAKWAVANNTPFYLIQGAYQPTPKPILKQIDVLLTNIFGKYILKHASGVGCKSHLAEKYVKSIYNRPTFITYIGLDESKFQNPVTKDWKRELMIVDKHILLYVGKIEDRRSPNLLLDIAAELPNDYVLIMVGKGPLYDQIRDNIKQRKLEQKVFLLGQLKQEELPALYMQSDLFLLASKYEIYGMVLLECMYFGLPAVSSFSGGADILIDDNIDGKIVREFDVTQWCNAIESVCSNEKILFQYKNTASEKIKKRFLWNHAVTSFINLYNLDNSTIL